MGTRKRPFDPNRSDSDDEDYDNRVQRARPPQASRKKPAAKKRRTGYHGDASEDISDSELADESFDDGDGSGSDPHDEDEPVELNELGRPKRRTTKQQVQYEESDGDSVDYMNAIDSDSDAAPLARKSSTRTAKDTESPPTRDTSTRRLVVKLRYAMKRPTSSRGRSTTAGKAPPIDKSLAARRSSRIAHDDTEGLLALTNSGNHVIYTRTGVASPEVSPVRPTKGGKGLKKPPSAVLEADEEQSARTEGVDGEEIRRTEAEDDAEASADVATTTRPEKSSRRADDADDDESTHKAPGDANESGDGVEDAKASDAQMGSDQDEANDNEDVDEENEAEDDDDDDVLAKPRRGTRRRTSAVSESVAPTTDDRPTRRSLRSAAQQPPTNGQSAKRRAIDDTSDFEPPADDDEEEAVSSTGDEDNDSPRKADQPSAEDDSSHDGRRSKRLRAARQVSPDFQSDVADELAVELQELRQGRSNRSRRARHEILFEDHRPQTRKRKVVNYRIPPPEAILNVDEEAPAETGTPRQNRGGAGGGWQRSLFSTYGPFGGAGGPAPLLGGPGALATGGVDSDSSDDDTLHRSRATAGGHATTAMTPTAGTAAGGLSGAQPTGDALQASLGKVKDRTALADADPLGVDPNVSFDKVGGLDGHIDQLKEMVALPLLYPEIFQRFHVTPPRGVLFHGPPGTGKTLLARALAATVSSHGKKVTFYMRKGADALSKWVGEAERQLRLLFEEARKTQPSIIFFDEIDGLAPVRSSKQEQIHSSIVSTLLALMDGMDGRGQVIVIGATNRPDSVDPALRRPGRFDREFYFPLPAKDARRKILDIHTKDWQPPVPLTLKDELAEATKGYGGADLRALCTEAALNAVQRRYPQIYTSDAKLQIDPASIQVSARDFMMSVKKIVPSSERSASSGAAPLPKNIEPLLRQAFKEIEHVVAEILPRKQQLTALEEAHFEDALDDHTIAKETMHQDFERARVFRPRLLIRGAAGMGQQYLAAALLHHFEGMHVSSFDLPALMGDPARSAEAAIVQMFAEVKRHKPSVIYIPNVDVWYDTVGAAAVSTFLGMLRSLPPTDPVLLLGVLENGDEVSDASMLRTLFGFSKRNQYEVSKPSHEARVEYFKPLADYICMRPSDFPDPADRKKRVLETLAPAPVQGPKSPPPRSKEELKAEKKKDRHTLNVLKIRIQPIMDQIRTKYKKFRNGPIDEIAIRYLFEEDDPSIVTSDVPTELRRQATFRPYEKGTNDAGEAGLIESASGKFYYNLDTVTIEKRLSNGYYKRPKDFLADIKRLAKDARTLGDAERLLKANELLTNVEVDVLTIEMGDPGFLQETEEVYQRELRREKERIEKAQKAAEAQGRSPTPVVSNMPMPAASQITSTDQGSGAIVLGEPHVNGMLPPSSNAKSSGQPSLLTNGTSHGLSNGASEMDLEPSGTRESNGTSGPSANTHMTNSDEPDSQQRAAQNSSFGQSAQTRPLDLHTGGSSSLQQRMSMPGGLSQTGFVTSVAAGSNPGMYENTASTTSSDKRNTGSSGRAFNNTDSPQVPPPEGSAHTSVLPTGPPNVSERSEGAPDLSLIMQPPESNSQLPSTQGTPAPSQTERHRLLPTAAPSSSPSEKNGVPATRPPVPAFPREQHAAKIDTLLNPDDAPTSSQPRKLIVDSVQVTRFVEDVVQATRQCTVEQLEQVHSGLMNAVWRTRGQWDRVQVVEDLGGVLQDIMEDIRACQDLLEGTSAASLAR